MINQNELKFKYCKMATEIDFFSLRNILNVVKTY